MEGKDFRKIEIVIEALRKHRGIKAGYKVVEDDDPTGYKSNIANDAKKGLGIEAVDFPRYSPNLNPLDSFLWSEVERRMAKNKPSVAESVEAYKSSLTRTAKAIPTGLIRAAVGKMKSRAAEVARVGGGKLSVD